MAILGIDEVGRGPWAGPLVIGACILPPKNPENSIWVDQLTDSKKLTSNKREELNNIILKECPATATGWVSAKELDEIGLTAALKLATRRAVQQIKTKNSPFNQIIIDGTQNFLAGTTLESYVTTLKKADFLIKEVSAASIIAKVARDNYMVSLAKKYPGYGFENHVGYGTAAHKSALKELGPTPEHRKSFRPIAEIIGTTATPRKTPTKNTTKIGQTAENITANYLQQNGHTILARNHKTKYYEIDIISVKDDKLYFTEVRYRKNIKTTTPLDTITKKKREQMTYAATAFLKFTTKNPNITSKQPLLAVAALSGSPPHLETWFTLPFN